MSDGTLTFDNPDIVAFIQINQKITPKLSLRDDGKVVFCFNEDVSKSLDDFASNKPVGANDYATAIRSVRGLMYLKKRSGR